MDEVQNPSNFELYTPSSEPFRLQFSVSLTPKRQTQFLCYHESCGVWRYVSPVWRTAFLRRLYQQMLSVLWSFLCGRGHPLAWVPGTELHTPHPEVFQELTPPFLALFFVSSVHDWLQQGWHFATQVVLGCLGRCNRSVLCIRNVFPWLMSTYGLYVYARIHNY
jgi:hypothetical protein